MWVIATLASLLVLVIFVLCVPLDVRAQVDVYGRPRFRVRLAWLFGLVGKEFKKGEKKPEKKKRVVEGKPRPRRRRGGAKAIFKILRTRGLLRQLKGLLKDVISRIRIREFGADFRVELDNPADTGFLFALIGPATLFLNSFYPHRIRIEPSFKGEAVLEGYLYGTVRLWPILLVTPFLRFIFSLVTLRVVKVLVLTKWKKVK